MPGAFKSLPKVRDRVAELRAETRGQLVRDGERYSMNRIAHPLLFRDAFSKFGQPAQTARPQISSIVRYPKSKLTLLGC